MKMLLWTGSFSCIALWSLLAWGATGLLGAALSWAPALRDDPLGLGLTIANWADWLGLAGQGAILLIWAIGTMMLLTGTVLLSRGFRAIGRLASRRGPMVRRIPLHTPYRSSGTSMQHLAARLAPRLLRAVRR